MLLFKWIVLVIVLISIGNTQLSAQDTTIVHGYDKNQIKKIINKHFGNLFSPQSKNNIGNFASLDLNQTEVSFSGNVIFRNGSILGVKMTGGAVDGILPIFSNSTYNRKLGIDIQYNILDLSQKSIQYSKTVFRDNERKKEEIRNQYNIKLIEIKNGEILKKWEITELEIKIDNFLAQLDTSEVKKELKKTEKDILLVERELENYPSERELLFNLEVWKANEISKLNKWKDEELKKPEIKAIADHRSIIEQAYKRKRKDLENQYHIRRMSIDQDTDKRLKIYESEALRSREAKQIAKLVAIRRRKSSVDIEIEKLKKQIDIKNKEVTNYKSVQGDLEVYWGNWKAKELKKIDNNIINYGFKMGWYSIGIGLSNRQFNLFFPDSLFESQIKKDTFAAFTFRIQYSSYKLSPVAYKSYYISHGLSYSYEDNLSSLKRVDISEETNYGPNPQDRSVTKKYNAYVGDYKDKLHTLNIYGDFYWFIFKNNIGALHFYPECIIKENYNPSIDLGFGFLLVFKDKKATENIINTELYFALNNISNSNNSPESLLGRSDFGIRFTVPINYTTIN